MSESSYSPWTPTITTNDTGHQLHVPTGHLERVRALLHKHKVEHDVYTGETPDYSVFEFASAHSASDLIKILQSLDEV